MIKGKNSETCHGVGFHKPRVVRSLFFALENGLPKWKKHFQNKSYPVDWETGFFKA
jgi:hypothetical protein